MKQGKPNPKYFVNTTHAQKPYTCRGAASMRSRVLPALLVGLGFILTGPVTAQTFKTLHAFKYSDGATPYSELVLSGNTLYGTASAGGNSGSYNGNGALFAVNTDGSGFTNEYIFTAYPPGYYYTNTDGSVPFAGLILSGTNLYGAAYDGGAFGAGTVFAVNTNGSGFTNLYSFTGGNDGGGPDAALVLSSNILYGTTAYGGGANNGTVFAININGTGFTNLFNFTNGISGDDPAGVLILSGRTLYGTTSGGNGGFGTVFAINTDGSSFTNLHVFSANSGFPLYTNSDGSNPNAGLVLAGKTLYGAAAQGGKFGSGTLFAVNTNGSGFTNLYTFTATSGSPLTNRDGANPRGSLIASGGTLYGTAYNGGRLGSGTLFAISTNGSGFTNLYTFTANSTAPYTNSDGSHPNAALLLSGNTLYGTAYNGGNPSLNVEYGTVFSFTLASVSPPLLAINHSGTNVILTWPTNTTGFTLESTTNLVPPVVWITNSPPPVVVNTNNTSTNGITGAQKFYRLSQ
jgi:uncharacterized repeat protein (TIGR03803 family)